MSKESNNILRELLASRPVRVSLDFGIQENVRLIAIDNKPRKKDGETIQRNTYMTFARFDKDNRVIAQSEFNYFNLRPDSEYTATNIATQVSQLANIVSVVNPKGLKKFNPTADYEDMSELQDDMKTKDGCKKLMSLMFESFEEALGDKVGHDGPLMRLKVISDYKSGKYLQLPDDANVVQSMEAEQCNLNITPAEQRNRDKASLVTRVKADSAGNSPDVSTSTSAIIDI